MIWSASSPRPKTRMTDGTALGSFTAGQPRLRFLRSRLFAKPASPAAEQGLPVPIGFLLSRGFGSLGFGLLAAHPAAVVLDVTQVLPGGVAIRVKNDSLREVGDRLGFQAVLFAPEAELDVFRCGLARVPEAFRLGERILSVLARFLGRLRARRADRGRLARRAGGCIRPVCESALRPPESWCEHRRGRPSALVFDLSQQTAGQDALGFDQHGPVQVLGPLGLEAVGLAPKCKLNAARRRRLRFWPCVPRRPLARWPSMVAVASAKLQEVGKGKQTQTQPGGWEHRIEPP